MTAQIIQFPADKTFDEDVTEEIKMLLKKLKRKKVNAYFLIVAIDNEDKEWTGHYNYESDQTKWELLGGVEALKHHLITKTCFKEGTFDE